MNPQLTITFSDRASPQKGKVQTIGSEWLVSRSIKKREQLLNGLEPSSNRVTLQVLGRCPSIRDIIAADSDIKATLKDGDNTIFTGYLSTSWNWSVTNTGERAVDFTLEDVGTRVLGKEFISSGCHLFNCTVSAAVKAICDKAGITVSPDCPTMDTKVTGTVSAGTSCGDILRKMLGEVGHVHFFDNLGRLSLYRVDCSTTEGAVTLNGDVLLSSISVSRTARQYHSARVSYKSLGEKENVLVYRNTTGQDDSHPYCHMEMGGKSSFDGTEVYATDTEGRTPALIEACNAEGVSDVGEGKILSVSSVETTISSDSAFVTGTVTSAGGPYLSIDVRNSDSTGHFLNRLDAYGSVVYEKTTEVIRTSPDSYGGDADNVISQDLEFIHTRIPAKEHANLLSQYHRNCSTKYTFRSNQEANVGSIVRLMDDVHSGLDVHVLVVEKTTAYGTAVWSYGAVGISSFSLDEDVITERILDAAVPAKGKDGEDSFSVTVISSNGMIFRNRDSTFTTTLTAYVHKGGTDITSTISGNHFRWRRSSGDENADRIWNNLHYPLSTNRLTITMDDILGRCSFFAEYIR